VKKKIVYLSYMPLTDYVIRTWFIDYLINKGKAIEYWDVTTLLRGKFNEHGEKQKEYVRKFRSYKEIEAAFSEAENVNNVYVVLITLDGKNSLKLYRLLGKYHCKTVFIKWGGMPIKTIGNMGLKRFLGKFINPVRVLSTTYYLAKKNLYCRLRLIEKYNLCLVAGESLLQMKQFADKVVSINMSDYDTYLDTIKQKTTVSDGSYAVFLDINLPFQSDLALSGVKALNADEYYASLNRFFDLIERFYDTKVVVASHHKANNSQSRFNGRECHRGKTAELVKDADFVISHHSTSISFAVLNKKPIVFIYTNAMREQYNNCRIRWINDLAEYFDLHAYNVDEVTDGGQVNVQKPNIDRYSAYKYSYLTSRYSENLWSADIILREISAI